MNHSVRAPQPVFPGHVVFGAQVFDLPAERVSEIFSHESDPPQPRSQWVQILASARVTHVTSPPVRFARRALVAALPIAAAALFLRPDRAARVATGWTSQMLCSAAFVEQLPPEQTYAEVIRPMPGIAQLAWALRYTVDAKSREVRATLFGGFESHAAFREGSGCTLLGLGPDPAWLAASAPGEDPPLSAAPLLPPIVGPERVEASDPDLATVLERAFAAPTDRRPSLGTKAVVVVRDGRVIAERYAPGIGLDTPLLGFSATKSVINALLGLLVRDGKLSVHEAAPVPEWQAEGDPRRAITIDNLLRMTSGLALAETHSGFDPVSHMMFLEPDMAAFAVRQPLEAAPGTRFAYSSGNTLILTRILQNAVGGKPGDLLRFARNELFGPLGMTSVTFESDAAGTPIGSTRLHATARDWARFGMLYVEDGLVAGRRILPEGFVSYSTTETLGSHYAAGFWLPSPGWRRRWPQMPKDVFYAAGMLGQFVVVIPSERLVIARLGVTHRGDDGLHDLVSGVVASLGRGRSQVPAWTLPGQRPR